MIVLNLALLILLFYDVQSAGYQNCGRDIGERKLVDESTIAQSAGEKTNTLKHPWAVVFLRNDGKDVHCSGSLIHPKYVITAAHCFSLSNPDNFKAPIEDMTVAFSLSNVTLIQYPKLMKRFRVRTRKINKLYIHPNFTYPASDNDVAVVELDEAVPLGSQIWPLCMPESAKEDPDYLNSDSALLVGYGPATDESDSVNQIRHKVQPHWFCKKIFEYEGDRYTDQEKKKLKKALPDKFSDGLLCGGDSFGSSKGTCGGDSGAPLLTDRKDRQTLELRFELLAVLHGGLRQCDNSKMPAIYVRLTTPLIYNWLMNNFFLQPNPTTNAITVIHVRKCQDPNLCQNGGTCKDTKVNPGYKCICQPAYTGNNCERPQVCETPICKNKGTCYVAPDNPFSFKCKCAPPDDGVTFSGLLCHERGGNIPTVIDILPPKITTASTTATTTTTTINSEVPNYCSLPDDVDPYEFGGILKPLVDCTASSLAKFDVPPHTVWTLKGSYAVICCPSERVGPPIENVRYCTEDEIEDYDNDEDSVDCEIPPSTAPKFTYAYNDERICPVGTNCTTGNKCGPRDFNEPIPPESCGFDFSTGQDKFCCADLLFSTFINWKGVENPQPPLFPGPNGKARPCMDQTSHCEKWAKSNPENCSPKYSSFGQSENRYPFMREVCQESCQGTTNNFRSDKCKKGCIDEYENCPLWSRLGFCNTKPQFMSFNCRESCGSCGFKSPHNTENQIADGRRQVSDISSKTDLMCGQSRIKGNLDEEKRNVIENYQVEKDGNVGICSHVIISDKYALTAANCWENWLSNRDIFMPNDFSREKFRFIIRQDTEFEEVMNVKRFWINPWRSSTRGRGTSAYYNIVIMEFDRRIEYNYEKYGDSPSCIGEENEIDNQIATMRGLGILPDETVGELTETNLNIISNDECYKKFLKPRRQVSDALYDGITDQILCTTTACDPAKVTRENRLDKCDASQGDSGAPLLTIGSTSQSGETFGETAVAIHTGGESEFVAASLKRKGEFLPKWWIRLASFSEWIKCTARNAVDKSYQRVERGCDTGEIDPPYPPRCDHELLRFIGETPKGC